MEEILQEEIKQMKKKMEELQKDLNNMRKQLIELERKTCNDKNIENETMELLQMPPEVLEKAQGISLREAVFITNLNKFLRRLEFASITTLRELYERFLENEKVRSIGEAGSKEIKLALKDLPELIKKVEERRRNIENNDVPIQFLINNECIRKKLYKLGISTLKELYYKDVNTYRGILREEGEKQIISIFQRY